MTTVGTVEHFLWLDLETTGLDPNVCGIIEIAWAITPLDLGPLNDLDCELVMPGEATWEGVAYEMHSKSGLAHRAVIRGRLLADVERDIVDDLVEGETYYLAGSSIHFDRGFIRRHMPALETRLHYRMLDVSAVVLARRAQGWVSPPSPDPKPHRAAEDLRNSHALLLLAALEGMR